MSKEVINIGTVANDGTGDRIRVAFTKTNNNFTELYNTNNTQNNNINAAFLQANGAFALANSSSIYANGAFGTANSASVLAQAAFNYANTIVSDTQIDPYSRNHANASFDVANSAAAYSNTVSDSQNTSIQFARNHANASFDVANSAAAYSNTVSDSQNTSIQFARNHANSSFGHANASFDVANSAAAYSNTVDATQNTNISYIWNYANAAFSYANTISGGSAIDNVARVVAETANDTATSAGFYANGAFASANNEAGVNATQNTNITIAQNTADAGFVHANASFNAANNEAGVNATQNTNITNAQNTADAGFIHANASFNAANNEAGVNATQNTNITNAQNTGDAAFIRANNSLNANTGGEISGNLLPTTTNTYYLGSDSNRWHSLYVGPGSIDLGGLVLSNQNGTLAVSVGGQPPTQISGSDEYARNTANAAFASANNIDGINATQNTNIQFAWNHANSAFESANNVAPQIEPAFTTANGAFAKANNAQNTGDAAFLKANNEAGVNATQNTNITNAQNTGDAAFAKANNEAGVNATQNTNITNAQNTADAGFIHANASFNAANNVFPQIQPSFNTANAAFIRANNSLDANNGGTITGDLSISGNLSVLGNTFTVSATTIVANDTVLVLGSGNYTSDLLDIGISAHYNDGVNAHTGLIRDHGTKEWQLFEGYTGEIGANNDIIITDPSFKIATLNANLKSQSITLNSQDLQTYVDGSYNKANAAFAFANNIDGINTTQNNSITAAFAAANNEAGVNATQNTNITTAQNTANAAFLTANTAYSTNYISGTKLRLALFVNGSTYSLRFPDIFEPVANNAVNPILHLIAGQTYAFDLSGYAGLSGNFGGLKLMTKLPFFADSAYLPNVTHVSPNGVVTTNVSSPYTSGTLYWTASERFVGNTAVYVDDYGNVNGGSIKVYRPDDISNAFRAANTASNTAVYRSLTPAATKFRIIEGPTSSTWQIDQYSGNFPTIYVISGQTYVFDFNFPGDVNGSGSHFKLLDDGGTQFTGNVAYVSSANTSSITGAEYASTSKAVGSVYWKVPTSADGKTYKYQNGNNGTTGNIVIISHSALANAANSAGSSSADSYARNHANSSFGAANSAQSTATSGLNHASAAFNYANSVFTFSNSAFNLANTNYLPSPNKYFVSSSFGAGSGYYGGSQNPTLNPTFYATAGDTISFDLSGIAQYSYTNPPYAGGFLIRYNANSSNLVSDASSGLTHVSPTGVISTAAAAQGKISGQLFWKIPGVSSTIGFAANGVAQFVYQDALDTGAKVGSILVGPPTYILRQFAGAAFNQANLAFNQANSAFSAFNQANSAFNQANSAFIAANSSGSYANAAFLVANSAAAYSNTVNATQNTSITAAFAAANSAGIYANGAFAAANSAGGADTFARTRANSSYNGTALWAFGNYGGSQTGFGNVYGVIGNGINSGQTSSGEEIIGSSTSQSSYAWEKLDQGLTSSNGDTTHAIKTDGTLWGWGRNEYGQIGDNTTGGGVGSTRGRSSPVQIGTNNDWLEVATDNVCLAIRAYGEGQNQGTLWSWGQAHPTLGDNNGSAPARSSPVQIGSGTKWIKVAIGGESAYALQQNGSLWGWGLNNSGQIGQNSTAIVYYSQPVQISAGYPTSINVFKQISAGYQCVGGVKSDGTLWTWGSDLGDDFGNAYFSRIGILGQNSTIDRSSPTQVGANTNWKMVSMGYTHAMAIKTDNTLWTWGENQHKNTFGGNPNVGRSSPAQIGSSTSWKYVSAGKTHSAAITTDGYLRTCGNNNLSQAGSSQSWTTNHTTLKGLGADTVVPSVTGYLAKWKTVRASFNYSHAIKYQLDRDPTND